MTRSLERLARRETESATDRGGRLTEITAILSDGPVSIDVPRIAQLVDPKRVKPFDGGKLAIPYAEPEWDDFKPPHSNKFGSSLPSYKKAHQMSVLKYRLALTDWRKRERARIEEYNVARTAYEQGIERRIDTHNKRAFRVIHGVRNGDPEAVVVYSNAALAESTFPEWLRVGRTLSYRPSARELTMTVELPPREVLPGGTFDERAEMYEALLVLLTLRCLRDGFLAGPPRIVNSVRIVGVVGNRRLVAVRAERAAFGDLNLESIDPTYALTQLGAQLSPDPYGLVPIG
ncbi:hypothetical protein [Phytomonospora endophytica]|uniref:Uncharacterized protein n=1 Tax=Phytomonospora endophytica TaxID=714109 RepID=A0A841FV27_9ACTN|nr:hypothetical protein [Phytomonospora endophytica]MBB6037197.1 hypothetical protein [Phytomonospora endophytica]GIG71302.1 hypothetical protein Pen01_75970 [Phytomonospora endophytica]